MKSSIEGNARLSNPGVFLRFLRLLRTLSPDFTMKFDERSIRTRILDPSEVKMIDAVLVAIISPSLTGRAICLPTTELVRCFPRTSGRGNGHFVEITIKPQAASFKVGEISFSVRLPEETKPKDLPIPNVSFSSNFEVRLLDLLHAIDEMKDLTNNLEFSFTGQTTAPILLVAAQDESFEKSAIVPIRRANTNRSDKCRYDLQGLRDYLSYLRPISSELRVSFGTQLPVNVSATNPSPPVKCIEYYQAPLVEQ